MASELEIPKRGPRVFVSYSFSNARVTEFRNALERQGFRPTLVDASTLLGATSLAGAISTLIQDTDYVIQLVDGAALKSAWVQKELELAVEHKVPDHSGAGVGNRANRPVRGLALRTGHRCRARRESFAGGLRMLGFRPSVSRTLRGPNRYPVYEG